MAEVRSSSLRIDVNRYHFIWEFNGFNKIPFMPSHPILSSSFKLHDSSETLWQLLMAKEMRSKVGHKDDVLVFQSSGGMQTISGNNNAKPEKAVGFLMLKSDLEDTIWEVVKYHVQIKVGDSILKTEEQIENGDECYKNDSSRYIFASDLNGVNLFDQETVTIEAFIEHKQVDPRPLIPVTKINRANFTENLTHLFKSKKYADIILKAGDCEIAAHKCILAFRTVGLEPDFARRKDEVEVQAMDLGIGDESVAEAFLLYAYTGKIPIDFPIEKYTQLYAEAEKYKAEELKILIKELLLNYIYSRFCPSCVSEKEYIPQLLLSLLEDNPKCEVLNQKCEHKLQQ